MTHTQAGLQALLKATQAVVELETLPVVLERIARAAVELVDAEYGALGVIATDRDGLESFIHVGMPEGDAAAIGHLPEGRGVLGALIDDPMPIRLQHLADHPRSVGFPAAHPQMDAFLGVPISIRSEVYGNLYLTNPRRGAFTEEDEQLVTALAATAGFVIANARLFEETRLRQQWAAASAQIASTLLESSSESALSLLADELIGRTTADRVCVVLRGAEPLTVHVAEARGDGAEDLAGLLLPAMRTAASVVFEHGDPRTRRGARHDPDPDAFAIVDADGGAGAVMFLPLRSGSTTWGVLAVARRPGRAAFSTAELDLADDLAGRVALSIELARAREQRQRALLVDDRSRIARDLHDHVIQQLFATGLELQAIAESVPDPGMSTRLQAAVATLDESIAHIRTIIFAMTPRDERSQSVRHQVLEIAAACSNGLPQPVAVSFVGPVDLLVTGPLTEHVTAVVRELLMNAAKHASASSIQLRVTAELGHVRISVEDDGVGIAPDGKRSGLANLSARAESLGGTFLIASEPGRTAAVWSAPLGEDHDG
ncbi:GAF domain-containing protein [Agromyces lapidis]|uniref:GAF domain-containing protein n=1 Tax=Agromyces lapidis TaxID=279574 RepID=A0ABV5STW4_9MICO|nr:GAF domain-containing protein [Agromyces lapidis]